MSTREKTVHPRRLGHASQLIMAALIPLAAFGLQWMFWAAIKPYVWFLFFPAVFLSSWVGGLHGGLLATVLSTGLVWYFFIPPQFSFAVQSAMSLVSIGMFVCMGGLFSFFHGRLRRATQQTAEALNSVRAINDQLEERVLKRTADLQQTNAVLRASEERLRLLVENVKDYAIIMLDADARVVSWNVGAERIKGYRTDEIVGQHFSRFYTKEDVERGKPERELAVAVAEGRFEEVGWRVRKDGSQFIANMILTVLRDDAGRLRGFAKITRDITAHKQADEKIRKLNDELEQRVTERTAQLATANKELEAFSYSVSHDLRAPLRGIDGFSQALLEDYGSSLDTQAQDYLARIRAGTQRMAQLIDDMLLLARVTRAVLRRESVNLSTLVEEILAELRRQDPARHVECKVAPNVLAECDPDLIRQVLQNLLDNAWKFTSKSTLAHIAFGVTCDGAAPPVYCVADNGAGFDPAYADKLFGVFQRLHAATEFPGTGVGLATVRRIVRKHGGEVRAESQPGKGAAFFFTLSAAGLERKKITPDEAKPA